MDPSSQKYPRTLIIGAHFSQQSGTGLYLGRLFTSWPVDRLATIDSSGLSPDWRRCRLHYRTGDKELRLRAPLRWFAPARSFGPSSPSAGTPINSLIPSNRSLRRRLEGPIRSLLQCEGVRELLYHVAPEPSPKLVGWIKQFQPSVIYGCCSDLNSIRFLQTTVRALKLPLVLQLMDDWPENLYRDGILARRFRETYVAEFSELIKSATVAIAICKEMAEEYQCRYGRSILWFPMPVELQDYRDTARTQWQASRPFRIRYGGRVGWAIRESLLDVAQAVAALRQDGIEVSFEIITPQREEVPAACFTIPGVSVLPLGPLASLPKDQAEADLLLVCYDFDPESYRLARFSMPSKLADCMASGTPILVYGPRGLPVVEYARTGGWGKLVDRRDSATLKSAIEELVASAALREQFGRQARSFASQYHDANTVSENLRATLIEAAKTQIHV